MSNSSNVWSSLLVKLENCADLFSVDTVRTRPFKAWSDENGVDLYWSGRRVEKVYRMSVSGKRWWHVPVPSAVRSLLKHGYAVKTNGAPKVEDEEDLPE